MININSLCRVQRLAAHLVRDLHGISVLMISAAFFLLVAGPAQAVLYEKDCTEVVLFNANIPKLTPAQCTTMGAPNGDFFAGTLTNGNKSSPGWKDLPVCLGFGEDINAYLAKNPNSCRRLSARESGDCLKKMDAGATNCWTAELNQQFLQCTVDGNLSPKALIWTTTTADISKKDWGDSKTEWIKQKSSVYWKKMATSAEMCYVYRVKKEWVLGIKK